ncbi:GTPase [Ulvibacterium sp.]|uniref:GTPase n=1 Tax=Ulvibacterium sp. TaxID=2665914 RepID=UPI0026045E4A|nr:GTPase [Ulvibacterium sp.]
MQLEKLIFIYNADSGLRNLLIDGAHKILSPDTYECNLCDITYGAFTENKVWKDFRKNSDLELEFLHKDEFAKAYRSKFGYKFTFPIVLALVDQDLEVFIKTEELNALEDARALIGVIQERKNVFL